MRLPFAPGKLSPDSLDMGLRARVHVQIRFTKRLEKETADRLCSSAVSNSERHAMEHNLEKL
eukprot:5244628-Amphidinium_carterae.1